MNLEAGIVYILVSSIIFIILQYLLDILHISLSNTFSYKFLHFIINSFLSLTISVFFFYLFGYIENIKLVTTWLIFIFSIYFILFILNTTERFNKFFNFISVLIMGIFFFAIWYWVFLL